MSMSLSEMLNPRFVAVSSASLVALSMNCCAVSASYFLSIISISLPFFSPIALSSITPFFNTPFFITTHESCVHSSGSHLQSAEDALNVMFRSFGSSRLNNSLPVYSSFISKSSMPIAKSSAAASLRENFASFRVSRYVPVM